MHYILKVYYNVLINYILKSNYIVRVFRNIVNLTLLTDIFLECSMKESTFLILFIK